jgi:hypothetical protein
MQARVQCLRPQAHDLIGVVSEWWDCSHGCSAQPKSRRIAPEEWDGAVLVEPTIT